MSAPLNVSERIRRTSPSVTPAERRVAELVVDQPQAVAFGTVAELAAQARVGVATVARLAAKLGYDGFSALQAAVQHDLARQLRPAVERIRGDHNPQLRVEHHLEVEIENLRTSLEGLENNQVNDWARRLAGARWVWVLSGDASHGVAGQFAQDLAALRDHVEIVAGNEVAVHRQIARVEPADVVVAVDLRRYERWLIAAVDRLASRGPWILALSDRVMSPLSARADAVVVVGAVGGGPFDSHVGTLAVFNTLVAATADELQDHAGPRLERAEQAWRDAAALLDE